MWISKESKRRKNTTIYTGQEINIHKNRSKTLSKNAVSEIAKVDLIHRLNNLKNTISKIASNSLR
jgi:hypothetical protein